MQQDLYLSPSAIFWIYQSQFNQAAHLFYDDSLVYCHNSIRASFVVQSNGVPCWERRLRCEIRQKKHKLSRPLQLQDMHLGINYRLSRNKFHLPHEKWLTGNVCRANTVLNSILFVTSFDWFHSGSVFLPLPGSNPWCNVAKVNGVRSYTDGWAPVMRNDLSTSTDATVNVN